MQRESGSWEVSTVAGESVEAFVPHPLPPDGPPLQLDGELTSLLEVAQRKLQLLELSGDLVPSVDWFVYAFVRKEAVLSAQIEGTQATLMDLLEVEASDEAPADADIEEVCGYLDALNYAWGEIEGVRGLPISVRLLSEAHRRLLAGARGSKKQPGEIRRSQNWIGGTRPGNAHFVPPPPDRLPELSSRFERYVHAESPLPPRSRSRSTRVCCARGRTSTERPQSASTHRDAGIFDHALGPRHSRVDPSSTRTSSPTISSACTLPP